MDESDRVRDLQDKVAELKAEVSWFHNRSVLIPPNASPSIIHCCTLIIAVGGEGLLYDIIRDEWRSPAGHAECLDTSSLYIIVCVPLIQIVLQF